MNCSPEPENHKHQFLYPRSQYYGKLALQHLIFNANLQEFAQVVSYLCALETGGKLTSLEAYEGIKQAWQRLEASTEGLRIEDE